MNLNIIYAAVILTALAGGGYLLLAPKVSAGPAQSTNAPAEEEHDAGEHGEAQATTILEDAAKDAGIVTEIAGPVAFRQTLPLSGKIMLNPNMSADVKARFPGIVRSARAVVGQAVSKGQILATVESNDSLQTYAVVSPLNGVIVGRMVNVGDTAADQAIFKVANLERVVAEFHVFPKEVSKVHTGQTVEVRSLDGGLAVDGTVSSMLPTADPETQTVLAWVDLPNPDNRWRAGMAVQGGAVTTEEQIALAVKSAAIQTLDDRPVVFVREGKDRYEARPVTLGRGNETWSEITAGLELGTVYVARNSFVVKADIGKAGAEHDH